MSKNIIENLKDKAGQHYDNKQNKSYLILSASKKCHTWLIRVLSK